ncbi:MAG: hypothetical protein KC482_04150 [Dehalococcoidia bacterium]|nr:hypothetical protein [Dehalococcoidia bacterium]MCA9845674.1 hypothetical protein [Dehalococcoidia bacterium]MCA9852775.1 hypothetical protein [Dehalococcoidia bacterium]
MPIAEQAYAELTLRTVGVLNLVVEQRTRREITEAMGIPASTLRDMLGRLESLTGSENQRELARWWQQNRVPWVRWLLGQMGLTLGDLA